MPVKLWRKWRAWLPQRKAPFGIIGMISADNNPVAEEGSIIGKLVL